MDTRTRIKTIITVENTTLKNIIEELNARHPEHPTTAQNMTNKLARHTIRFDEVAELADILGYEIVIRHKETKKEY